MITQGNETISCIARTVYCAATSAKITTKLNLMLLFKLRAAQELAKQKDRIEAEQNKLTYTLYPTINK